ncbi:ATP-grasp domain-containing protein, partial [Candidatus Omnitrophota bacterium]
SALAHDSQLVNLNLDSYELLRKSNFDLVFNLCDDGFRNSSLLEAHIPAMLDILQIPYTGSNFFTLAVCLNKARTKEILTFHNIPTAEFQVFYRSETKLKRSLKFPLIVKPLHEDASIGLKKESVVKNRAQLKERIEFVIKNYDQPALVERFVIGREIYVGILGSADNLTVLPISEVVFDQDLAETAKICSYDSKWIPESEAFKNTPVQCPAELDQDLEQRLTTLATEAYRLMKCQDYGRVDFRIGQDGQPYVLEVNPNPDISEDAGLSTMAKAGKIDYKQLIERILFSALERNRISVRAK